MNVSFQKRSEFPAAILWVHDDESIESLKNHLRVARDVYLADATSFSGDARLGAQFQRQADEIEALLKTLEGV